MPYRIDVGNSLKLHLDELAVNARTFRRSALRMCSRQSGIDGSESN